jgi:hypothetical protein
MTIPLRVTIVPLFLVTATPLLQAQRYSPLIAIEIATKSEPATLGSEVTTKLGSISDNINGWFDSLAAEIKLVQSSITAEIKALHFDLKVCFDKFCAGDERMREWVVDSSSLRCK